RRSHADEGDGGSDCLRKARDGGGGQTGERGGSKDQKNGAGPFAARCCGVAVEEAEAARDSEPERAQNRPFEMPLRDRPSEDQSAGDPEGGAEGESGTATEGVEEEGGGQACQRRARVEGSVGYGRPGAA